MDAVVPLSLRGEDELGVVPARPPRERPSYSWDGPVGRRVLLGWTKRSESVGPANGGRLRDGFELAERGDGWVHGGSRPFGTDELVAALLWAIHRVAQQFPQTSPVYVGDLSPDGGGSAPPHRSHQSGRDVDVGYYVRGNAYVTGFVKVDGNTLDAERTWAFLEGLLSTGLVQYIFVDYGLQPVLYAEALASGWTAESLQDIFQYPDGVGSRRGLIRHARGHDDHFHMRIHCPVEDAGCVP